jgi:3-oxoacyl-ACP reductase-like protein
MIEESVGDSHDEGPHTYPTAAPAAATAAAADAAADACYTKNREATAVVQCRKLKMTFLTCLCALVSIQLKLRKLFAPVGAHRTGHVVDIVTDCCAHAENGVLELQCKLTQQAGKPNQSAAFETGAQACNRRHRSISLTITRQHH